jgi:polysaccharide pyruvyl transferase WcaK-like protein
MKVLLGGVPFGCDNIGDEAILASVIAIFRDLNPAVELVVSTGDRKGAEQKFGVETVPLYGFEQEFPASDLRHGLKGVDLFVWAGATGLSDYPRMGCTLLREAQRQGVKTVVWNVGMNDVLNPSFFQIRGRKLLLCELVRKVFRYDLKRRWEERLCAAARRKIGRTLERCLLVVLRDARSLKELRRCGPFPDAISGADSALLQGGIESGNLPWNDSAAKRFQAADKRLAVCISAQNPIYEQQRFCDWLDRLHTVHPDLLTVMIPMNLKTDYFLMKNMAGKLQHSEHVLLTNFAEPEEVQELVGRCSLVISSRLHLMILALNRLVPCIGITRGSKIPFFLDEYGLPCAGTTDRIDFEGLSEMTERYLSPPPDFRKRTQERREEMLNSLTQAIHLLKPHVENGIGENIA